VILCLGREIVLRYIVAGCAAVAVEEEERGG
jgi:hypothetical protein